jgi:hydroxymethylbilane synthase
MQSADLLRIGTRASPLAIAQATETARLLAEAGHSAPELIPIRTTGDKITDRPLTEAGGKGLFTKEIDEALLSGAVDLAVHSAKDMPTRLPDGLVIAACLQREDVRDAFLSPVARTIRDLPQGARLGTSSLRRKALALRLRPDLEVVDMRGNVETRLRKLGEGVADATLLASAGLRRLGLTNRITSLIDVDDWLPASGQGAIAIVTRVGSRARALLAAVNHQPTMTALAAERAFLDVLDGSCRTPIGAFAEVEGDQLRFRGIIVKPDGSAAHDIQRRGAIADAEAIGRDAGQELAARGGSDFFGPR